MATVQVASSAWPLRFMCASEDARIAELLLDEDRYHSYEKNDEDKDEETWHLRLDLHTGVVQLQQAAPAAARVAVVFRAYGKMQESSFQKISVPQTLAAGAFCWSHRQALQGTIRTQSTVRFSLELLRLDTCESLGVTPILSAAKFADDQPHRLVLHRSGAALTFSLGLQQEETKSPVLTRVRSYQLTQLVEASACLLQEQQRKKNTDWLTDSFCALPSHDTTSFYMSAASICFCAAQSSLLLDSGAGNEDDDSNNTAADFNNNRKSLSDQ